MPDHHVDTNPCKPGTATAPDGARIVACAQGGQVLGWTPAPGTGGAGGAAPPDRLWVSPLARCGPGQAVRGGVPVVFPQFSDRGPLPKHGFARDRPWALSAGTTENCALVRGELVDGEATRAIWPHQFTVTLTARAAAQWLELVLSVRNDGTDRFGFTAALHTYLAATGGATVHGLAGARAEDNAAGGAWITVPDHPLDAVAARDIAVRDVAGPVRLVDPELGPLTLTREGLADVVVWNPGADHGIADLPGPQMPEFVCIEAAQLTPVALDAGQTWRGTARFTAG